MAIASTGLFWHEELEVRVRQIPGVRYHGDTPHGGKIFKCGSQRVVIPRGGDRSVQQGVTKDVEYFIRSASRGREFGTHPSDVERMRPVIEPDAAVMARPIVHEDSNGNGTKPLQESTMQEIETFVSKGQEAQRAVDELISSHVETTVEPPNAVPLQEETMATKTKKTNFQKCPVVGCNGRAMGRHLWAHKQKGELAADYSVRDGAASNGHGPKRKRERAERATSTSNGQGAVVGANVKGFRDAIHSAGVEIGKTLHEMTGQLDKLFKGPIADLVGYADLLHTENSELRRQVAQLNMQMDKARNAFLMVTEDKAGTTKRGVPVR